ncbi:hypothetical protein BGZ61DRAFT_375916 [Ilyonectria robusta]|uniref:uncharacterized protein n=1 Tax=Ilyonectria robusta TaxID=1079257 RepID=UPI001E8EDEFF|nr:uncharacterized protein BGZ61DRAFT_375916 [Ilyonectria robusta]KAH8649768.1 hypothetical protein BGZ61DRAFT_375916 [Ilyonectria robusta]
MPVLPLDVYTGGSPRPNCHPVSTTAPFGQDVDLALPFWPLNSRTDALLVCYFANQLSSWFDYCDKHRHFSTTVVQAAASHPILYAAILAISSKHLSLSQKADALAADRYQAICLEHLIPALANQDGNLDNGYLCAASMILRLYEEMTVPGPDERPYGHTLDVDIFTMSQDPMQSNYSLCRASLMIAVRQEIFISFSTRKPPRALGRQCGITRSTEPADDYTWVWRMIIHTEDVLSYVYGEPLHRRQEWDELNSYLDEWTAKRPPSFNPVWHSEPSESVFPEIWFANDFHVAGQQYADICRILLTANNPRMPSLGLDRLQRSRSAEEQIRGLVLNLCGVATCNTQYPPATFTAGMAIAVCGDRFTCRKEQKQLIEVVRAAESHMGWAILKQENRLCELWGSDNPLE